MIYGIIKVLDNFDDEVFCSKEMSWEEIEETLPVLTKPSIFGANYFKIQITNIRKRVEASVTSEFA